MIISIVFAVLSALCLMYYFVMISYAGIGTSFAPAWLVAFVFFALIAVLGFLDYRKIMVIAPIVKKVTGIFIAVCIVVFLVLEGMVISGMVSKPDKELDYIIVMGAKVKGTVPSKSLYKRIEKAAEYLKNNPNTIAIASGGMGPGEEISEAQCIRDYLINMGVEEDRIIMEDQSTSTEENIEFSMKIIKQFSQENANVGIVTNNFHVFRTLQVGNAKGYELYGLSAESDNILLLNYMVREAFALVQYKLLGLI